MTSRTAATARVWSWRENGLVPSLTRGRPVTANMSSSQREASMKRTVLQRRLIEIYKRGPLYSAEVLFSAQSVGQLVARYKYLHLLARRDKGLVHPLAQLNDKTETRRKHPRRFHKTWIQ